MIQNYNTKNIKLRYLDYNCWLLGLQCFYLCLFSLWTSLIFDMPFLFEIDSSKCWIKFAMGVCKIGMDPFSLMVPWHALFCCMCVGGGSGQRDCSVPLFKCPRQCDSVWFCAWVNFCWITEINRDKCQNKEKLVLHITSPVKWLYLYVQDFRPRADGAAYRKVGGLVIAVVYPLFRCLNFNLAIFFFRLELPRICMPHLILSSLVFAKGSSLCML